MKILLLCNKSPWPPLEGGPIAMNAMAEGLTAAGHTVKILAINSNKYSVDVQKIPQEYRDKTGIETVYLDLSVKPFPALKCMLKNRSYHVERFISADYENTLTRILKNEKFDIIQFETLFTTPYIPQIRKLSDARLVLRAHNIEHLIWQRMAEGCYNPLKRYYLHHLAKTLRQYELSTLHKLNGIVAITGSDADWFRKKAGAVPVTAIPFGINPGKLEAAPQTSAENPVADLFHLGSMNWQPNIEGIRWLVQKVWPDMHRQHPDLKLHLAGRAMPEWLTNLKMPGLVVDGEVEDAGKYMQEHGIMVVPLFSGSGIRIKIIEGMMASKAIITTPVGAEGIEYTEGKNIIIARNGEELIKAVKNLLENPGLARKIGAEARKLVADKHNNRHLMEKLTDFYTSLF